MMDDERQKEIDKYMLDRAFKYYPTDPNEEKYNTYHIRDQFVYGVVFADNHKYFTEEDAQKIERLVNEWHQSEKGETLADFLNNKWNE